MKEQETKNAGKPQSRPDLASVEANLFGALAGFCEKITNRMQESSLGKDKATVVAKRIKVMIQNITDEIKRSRNFDLAGRLESAYEEIRRLVEDRSSKDEQ
jgi:hypothetical protein